MHWILLCYLVNNNSKLLDKEIFGISDEKSCKYYESHSGSEFYNANLKCTCLPSMDHKGEWK